MTSEASQRRDVRDDSVTMVLHSVIKSFTLRAKNLNHNKKHRLVWLWFNSFKKTEHAWHVLLHIVPTTWIKINVITQNWPYFWTILFAPNTTNSPDQMRVRSWLIFRNFGKQPTTVEQEIYYLSNNNKRLQSTQQFVIYTSIRNECNNEQQSHPWAVPSSKSEVLRWTVPQMNCSKIQASPGSEICLVIAVSLPLLEVLKAKKLTELLAVDVNHVRARLVVLSPLVLGSQLIMTISVVLGVGVRSIMSRSPLVLVIAVVRESLTWCRPFLW